MTDRLDLIETIAKDDKFSTFSRLLGTSGADSVFNGGGQFTVFAPTNDAFGKIPDKRMNELLQETDQTKLKALLSYHILPGFWTSGNLFATQVRRSVMGQEVAFSDSNGLKVNGATVQSRNIEATNGVIHEVDTVLTQPPHAAGMAAGTNRWTQPIPVAEGVPTAAATGRENSIL